MKFNLIISLLQRLVSSMTNSGNTVVFPNGITTNTINEQTAGYGTTINPVVPDTPTDAHRGINKTLGDSRYAQLRGAYGSNITVTGDFDFSTLTNPTNFNDFTFTCAGATVTVGHLLNLPTYPCIIRVLTGKTITFTNKADANPGFIRNPGGVDFVAVGSNFDFGVFVNGSGAFIQRTGGGNYN